ncbi:UvrD-helicase domain-containing protein [Moritella viscosa]|uniref:UvrD-helicase domain-containing protein n=1 Tax=Moritella viscosa TaxID=80854 RepID=UPI000916B241|nr:UvrD-helicase domain-containing protein [Moritella viscosa]SGZ09234.1 Putative DNA helicase [Moritella viscosa]
MAIFMDALSDLPRIQRRKFKKTFELLKDKYCIRTPVMKDAKIGQVVIEGPCQTWLVIGFHEKIPTSEQLNIFFQFNKSLSELGFIPLKYLAVTEEDSLIIAQAEDTKMLTLVNKQDFFDNGHELIRQNLVESSLQQYEWIKINLFPESKIEAVCSTRRKLINHDNTAKLQSLFLDFDQESATKLDMLDSEIAPKESIENTVRLINGVAGCGKTLILINRALLYCNKFPEKKVILLIHNKPVTSDITHKIENFLGGIPKNLSIKTFHSFALMQQNKINGRTKPLFGDKSLSLIKAEILNNKHSSFKELKLSDVQIWSELEYINDYLIEDKNSYLEYERQGRGFAIQQSQRQLVWQLYELMLEKMCMSQGYLPSTYIRGLCLNQSGELNKFDHILIDEAQFFAPSWLQLVKKSLHSYGQLFMCADPNQGFLKNRLSWKSVGLNVRGRTKKLSHSYRTTYEIMIAANALLSSLNESGEDFIKPNFDKMERGSKPLVIYSDTPQDEKTRFLNELHQCTEQPGISLNQIMVLCGGSITPWVLAKNIEDKIGKGCVNNLNGSYAPQAQNYANQIKLMNINSCTGMESGITFVLGVGDILIQSKNINLKEDEKESIEQESIRKLYVAMTRAGQKLVLFSTEEMPSCLHELTDVVS